MDLIHKNFRSDSLEGRWVITIGNFDGFHLGHQALVRQVLKDKKYFQAKGGVLTFEPHPKKVLQPKIPFRQIYDNNTKWKFMEDSGLDSCFIIPFTSKFAAIGSAEFIEKLFDFAELKKIVVGYDFNFGRSREGSAMLLKTEAQRKGIEFLQMPAVRKGGITVSSTMIRRLLFEGDFKHVETFLGRAWSINGTVVEGNKLGHNLGFPTINVEPSFSLPLRNGVFACRLDLDGKIWNGVSNIGVKPTFGGERVKIEMNVFDFDRIVYGRFVRIYPLKFIRDEIKFDSVEDLKRQIQKDVETARDFFS